MLFLKSTKSKLFAGLVIISLATVVYLTISVRKPGLGQVAWQEVKPGRDSKTEVISKLGQPISASTSAAGQEILNFKGKYDFWPNQVFIDPQDQKADLIKERKLNTTPGELANYVTRFGPPTEIVANNLSYSGFYLHVYPQNGLAVNANVHNGVVFEVWYFPPTTIEKFKQRYAAEIGSYSENPTY